jgi:hypothetical protein
MYAKTSESRAPSLDTCIQIIYVCSICIYTHTFIYIYMYAKTSASRAPAALPPWTHAYKLYMYTIDTQIMYRYIHTHMCKDTHVCTHTNVYAIQGDTHAHSHMHMHVHAYIHTQDIQGCTPHRHTHTHTCTTYIPTMILKGSQHTHL